MPFVAILNEGGLTWKCMQCDQEYVKCPSTCLKCRGEEVPEQMAPEPEPDPELP